MTIDVKSLGVIDRFNGIDIEQTRDYVKLYNTTYINKMLLRHDWIHKEVNENAFDIHTFPVPMIADNAYQRKLETQPTPTADEITALAQEFGFGGLSSDFTVAVAPPRRRPR